MLRYAATMVNGPLVLLALVAYLRFRSDWTKPALLLLTLLAYNTALCMAIVAELRYSIPFTPLVIILSAYALVNIAARLSSSFKHGLHALRDEKVE
jgi:hypothetical protein